MKPVITLASLVLVLTALSARAQIQTLVVTPSNTNSAIINVSSNCYATIKTASTDYGGTLLINMHGVNFTFEQNNDPVLGYSFTGPATIQLQGDSFDPYYTTVDVEPGGLPPGQALAVGANSGNIQVTMQTSTDLVNWTSAVSGQTYTNGAVTQFFRIQLVVNP